MVWGREWRGSFIDLRPVGYLCSQQSRKPRRKPTSSKTYSNYICYIKEFEIYTQLDMLVLWKSTAVQEYRILKTGRESSIPVFGYHKDRVTKQDMASDHPVRVAE